MHERACSSSQIRGVWWGCGCELTGGRPAPPALVPARFTCDDVDFNLRVHSAGLLLCRFNRFSVMKKQIAVGGHRSFHITSKVGAAVCPERAAAHGGKAGGEATGHLRVSGVGLTAGKC